MAKLWNKDDPIIRSLLETDVYKIMMMYLIWKHVRFIGVAIRHALLEIDGALDGIDDTRELDQ